MLAVLTITITVKKDQNMQKNDFDIKHLFGCADICKVFQFKVFTFYSAFSIEALAWQRIETNFQHIFILNGFFVKFMRKEVILLRKRQIMRKRTQVCGSK